MFVFLSEHCLQPLSYYHTDKTKKKMKAYRLLGTSRPADDRQPPQQPPGAPNAHLETGEGIRRQRHASPPAAVLFGDFPQITKAVHRKANRSERQAGSFFSDLYNTSPRNGVFCCCWFCFLFFLGGKRQLFFLLLLLLLKKRSKIVSAMTRRPDQANSQREREGGRGAMHAQGLQLT